MEEKIRKQLEMCKSINDFRNMSYEIIKKILDNDTSDLLKGDNGFLGQSEKIRFEVFNLPQGISCPESTEICRQGCYQINPEKMHQAPNRDSAVKFYRKKNLLKSMQKDFVDNMVKNIKGLRPKKGQNIIIRIHGSGDFYSQEYMRKWFEIALRIRESSKPYVFVAYTKSMNILKCVMEKKTELDDLYMRVCGKTLDQYKIEDFNINLIGSVMDDTDLKAKNIMDEFKLPKYIVTSKEKKDVYYCGDVACADCDGLKCYTFPMHDVYTVLRTKKK